MRTHIQEESTLAIIFIISYPFPCHPYSSKQSPEKGLWNFVPLHTWGKLQAIHLEMTPSYFFWQPFCAFNFKSTHDDADQWRKMQEELQGEAAVFFLFYS